MRNYIRTSTSPKRKTSVVATSVALSLMVAQSLYAQQAAVPAEPAQKTEGIIREKVNQLETCIVKRNSAITFAVRCRHWCCGEDSRTVLRPQLQIHQFTLPFGLRLVSLRARNMPPSYEQRSERVQMRTKRRALMP